MVLVNDRVGVCGDRLMGFTTLLEDNSVSVAVAKILQGAS